MSQNEITITLTVDEATALLNAWEINEYPVSNALGRAGTEILEAAERKLKAAMPDA